MSEAAADAIEIPREQLEGTNTMQMYPTEVNNAETTSNYDANSGSTIERESIWITRGRLGKKDAENKTTHESNPTKEQTTQQRKPKMPPLPVDDYKVVWQPQAGLDLAK